MALVFNNKTALLTLLIILFIVALSSCGQFSLNSYAGFVGFEKSECGIATSAVSTLSSKESLLLIGSLLLLVTLNILVRTRPWNENLYTVDPPENLVTFIPKQIHTVTNQMQEAFRKGIIHAQIYESAA